MLGRKVRPRGSPFRTLPNPLPYQWDTTSFSPPKLLYEFVKGILSDETCNELVPGILDKINRIIPGFLHQYPECHSFESDPHLTDYLHDVLEWCGRWLKPRDPESNQELTLVIRTHFEIVTRHMGRGAEELVKESGYLQQQRRFRQALHSEERERMLMGLYYSVILQRVRGGLSWMERRRREAGPDAKDVRAVAVWVVLMLRMLCWLNLHTFDPGDVQVPKSDLMGTRLPVYIS